MDLLFEWGGRLRLGESLIAEGADLNSPRFESGAIFDLADHLFDEALDRYLQLERGYDPSGTEIGRAVTELHLFLSGRYPDSDALAIGTAALRGYLWRSVEQGPVTFLELELSEAVRRSRTLGEGRSPSEPISVTLANAVVQCIADGVRQRLGAIGGLISCPRHYEMALAQLTDDFGDLRLTIGDNARREAFRYGVLLADVERVIGD